MTSEHLQLLAPPPTPEHLERQGRYLVGRVAAAEEPLPPRFSAPLPARAIPWHEAWSAAPPPATVTWGLDHDRERMRERLVEALERSPDQPETLVELYRGVVHGVRSPGFHDWALARLEAASPTLRAVLCHGLTGFDTSEVRALFASDLAPPEAAELWTLRHGDDAPAPAPAADFAELASTLRAELEREGHLYQRMAELRLLHERAPELLRRFTQALLDHDEGSAPGDLGLLLDRFPEEGALEAHLEALGLGPVPGRASRPRRPASVLEALRQNGRAAVIAAETGHLPVSHDGALYELAELLPELSAARFDQLAPDPDLDDLTTPYLLIAHLGGRRFTLPALNYGDFQDFESVVGLINGLLLSQGSAQRLGMYGPPDEVLVAVAGPPAALEALSDQALLRFLDDEW